MKNFLAFLIVPIATVLFQLMYIDTVSQIISCFVYLAVNRVFSLICYKSFNDRTISLNSSKALIFALISVLTITDQLLKVIVHLNQASLDIIGKYFRIQISKNTNQAAALNLFNIELDTALIAAIKFFLIVIILLAFIKFKNKSNYLLYAFILLLPAAIANFIDSVVWGYTLDFFYFHRLVCYDLKDFYVDTAIGYLIITFLFASNKQTAD